MGLSELATAVVVATAFSKRVLDAWLTTRTNSYRGLEKHEGHRGSLAILEARASRRCKAKPQYKSLYLAWEAGCLYSLLLLRRVLVKVSKLIEFVKR